ncbi:type VII secretion target [Catellatospora sp. NPDC049609]|uniref:type VII secretion target n=1 Tax=Catellatospora sp. NPDC049609 TaxID=3155505 RepID=UPI00344A2C00
MEPTFAEGNAPVEPVRVEPDELVRLAAGLDGLSGALAREAPAATGLRSSPPGWAVGAAQAALAHEVTAHLAGVADDLAEFGGRLRVAGLSYADRDSALARRITAAARR